MRKYDVENKKTFEQILAIPKREKLSRYLLRKQRQFFTGVINGLGMAVGFTILTAIVIIILGYIASMNLPYIGDFINELNKSLEKNIRR